MTLSATGHAAAPEDVASIDAIIAALYRLISGPAGTRDWERLIALFLPDARLMRIEKTSSGIRQCSVMTPRDFCRAASEVISRQSFYEREVARRTERFGHLGQVFSTYEARTDPDSPDPMARGINGVQLFFDETRWWVCNMVWDDERPGNLIEPRYLHDGP